MVGSPTSARIHRKAVLRAVVCMRSLQRFEPCKLPMHTTALRISRIHPTDSKYGGQKWVVWVLCIQAGSRRNDSRNTSCTCRNVCFRSLWDDCRIFLNCNRMSSLGLHSGKNRVYAHDSFLVLRLSDNSWWVNETTQLIVKILSIGDSRCLIAAEDSLIKLPLLAFCTTE